jgi:hypothetical protein
MSKRISTISYENGHEDGFEKGRAEGLRQAAEIADKYLHANGYITAALNTKKHILAASPVPASATVGERCEWVYDSELVRWESGCGHIFAKEPAESCGICHRQISVVPE